MQGKLPLKQTKSRGRVASHGEVFTAPEQVKAMLDLVKKETNRPESKFLEPACGDGNFLEEILKRKLNYIKKIYKHDQDKYEIDAITAIASIYGIDILQDNVMESRNRMFQIFKKQYEKLFGNDCRQECLKAIQQIIKENIIWGNTLEMCYVKDNSPIIFYNWIIAPDHKIHKVRHELPYLVNKENEQRKSL